jgi:hypothetical protein
MTDPLDTSPEYRARMDQLFAATRDFAGMLRGAVDELTRDGWTDEQARALVVHAITTGGKS